MAQYCHGVEGKIICTRLRKEEKGKKKRRKKKEKKKARKEQKTRFMRAPFSSHHKSATLPDVSLPFFFLLQDAGGPPHANSWSSDKGWQGQLQFRLQPLELCPAISRWRRWDECDGTVLTLFPGLSVQHCNNCEYWHCWSVVRLCREVCTVTVG